VRTLELGDGVTLVEYDPPTREAGQRMGLFILRALMEVPADKRAEAELLAALDGSDGCAYAYVWPPDDRRIVVFYSGALIGWIGRGLIETGVDAGDYDPHDPRDPWNIGEPS
jgi:hypothetical protein